MFHEVLQFCADNFENIITIVGSVIVGASAGCALIPGGGLVKRILAVLALNIRNATPEQIVKAKTIVNAAAAATKPSEESKK